MKFRKAGAWVAVSALIAAAIAAGLVNTNPLTCNLNATTANFASQLAASTNGQTICLASGNYGSFAGTTKTVTIAAADGATPVMTVAFNTGDSGFTLQGMTGMSGTINGSASNITIKNSNFSAPLVIDGPLNSNILLDNNVHDGNGYIVPDLGTPAAIHLSYGDATHSGVTIQNSTIREGDWDGIQTGVGVNILNNEFTQILDRDCVWPSGRDCNHTDSIQLIGAVGSTVDGNYIHGNTDGIVAFDGVTGATIEDNVITDIGRGSCIDLYDDSASTVNHNTCPDGDDVALDSKAGGGVGSGTIIRNNILGGVTSANGSTAATNTNNMFPSGATGGNINGTPTFTGGATPTTWAGFALASGSAGEDDGSDGLDVGIRAGTPFGTILWRADGETGILSAEWASYGTVENCAVDTTGLTDTRAVRQNTVVAQGSWAYSTRVFDGDDCFQERAEIAQDNPQRGGDTSGFSFERNFHPNTDTYVSWQIRLGTGFPLTTSDWQNVHQWKQVVGGNACCPFMTITVHNSQFYFNQDGGAPYWEVPLSPATTDTWYRFTIHFKVSTNPAVGYVEIWSDEGSGGAMTQVMDKTFMQTTDVHAVTGLEEEVHARIGIYRNPVINQAGGSSIAYYDGYTAATTRAAAEANAFAP